MPIDYFHQKLWMIQEVFQLSAVKTIIEIMMGAPKYWSVLIDTSRIQTLEELQYYIKYHKQSLLRNPETQTQDLEKHLQTLEQRSSNWSSKFSKTFEVEVEANYTQKRTFKKQKPIGAHVKFTNHSFQKRDDIVSRGKTPKDKGAQACRHCGSLMHWDFNHPFDGKGKEERKTKAFLSTVSKKTVPQKVKFHLSAKFLLK